MTYGKAEAAFARCFGVKSADILVERMKARELDPYSALDKFVSYLLANTAAPKTVLTYVTAIKGLLRYEGISLDSYQLRAKVELPWRRNVTTGQVLAAEEHMHRRQEEERKRRLLDFIQEVMRIILNEYLSSRPTDAKQCRHRVACKGLHSLDG